MSQPVWEYITNLGDASPVDHGGAFVYRDKTGVYGVELEHLEPPSDDEIEADERRKNAAEKKLEKQYEAEHPDAEWKETEKYIEENLATEYESKLRWTVHRVCCDRLRVMRDENRNTVLINAKYTREWDAHSTRSGRDEWFHDSDPEHLKRHGYDQRKTFTEIAEQMGMSRQDLRELFCSANPAELASAYYFLAEHHGWEEFDQYPLTFTREEVLARYTDGELGRQSRKVSELNSPSA